MTTAPVTPLSEHFDQNSRFWFASACAFVLVLCSWLEPGIMRRIYLIPSVTRPWGEYAYILLRLLVMGAFLIAFMGFRRSSGTGDPNKVLLTSERSFDPLMGLRAFACGLVLLGHYFMVVYPPAHADQFTRSSRTVLILLSASPWGGVWVFFTLSGYLMGKGFTRGRYTLDEPGFVLYLRNRMLRIAPIYYTSIFLLSVWIYPQVFHWKALWILLKMFIFDFNGQAPISPDGVLWSVTTEVQFYFLVPVLLFVLLSLRSKVPWLVYSLPVWLLTLGVGWRLALLKHFPLDFYSFGYTPLVPNLDLFLTGLSLNLLPRPTRLDRPYLKRFLPALLLGTLLTYYLVISPLSLAASRSQPELLKFWTIGPGITAAFSAVFIYVAEIHGRISLPGGIRKHSLLAIQGLGTLTYCIYVFHAEVFISLRRILPTDLTLLQSILFFPGPIVAVLLIAWIFNRFVEEPFELRKQVSR